MSDDERPGGAADDGSAEVPGPFADDVSDTSGVSTEVDDSGAAGSSQDPDDGPRRGLPLWQESILLVGAAIVLAILIKALFVQAFYIPSASMEPGLVNDDRILVQKPSYWFGGEPSRGDVVVFEDPGGWLGPNEDGQVDGLRNLLSKVGLYPTGGHLVKRVVGVAGDTVSCCDDQGRLMVNGTALDEEDYIAARPEGVLCDGPMIGRCDWSSGVVPEGTIFVMGDNRSDSADSSYHLCLEGETDCTDDPFVDTDLVVGKVFSVVWPLSHFGFVSTPDSFADVPDVG
ncbi:signal peptidase I [Nocardioides sp.]|uniref:signal peptidase I n=1 Tax=Nocardioides sp. TaxID=35761 RepID=UPI00260DFC17|nr:signal peptidase I [Nocardioides sp.]